MKVAQILPLGLRRWDDEKHADSCNEGYEFNLLEDCDNAYRFTAVAAAQKISAIFKNFARFLNNEAFFILEYYPEESLSSRPSSSTERPTPAVFYSPYMDVDVIIHTIAPYLDRMVHDGFVGFGLANNRKGLELFYSEEKVLTFFTDNHLRITNFLTELDVPCRDHLTLPQDFGHDHLSLLSIPREHLPLALQKYNSEDLNSVCFCEDLTDQLSMYEVEEGLSFFLTRKEQEEITEVINNKLAEHDFADAEFGGLLLDWSDFVTECEHSFDGDLWEYKQGLKIRDTIQLVIDHAPSTLAEKITSIVSEPDRIFATILTDRFKRIDPPENTKLGPNCFWYQGVVRNQGSDLRRDLIRSGWFKR